MSRIAFLFPGQGSQSVGMGAHLLSRGGAAELLSGVDGLTGVPGLGGIISGGPEEMLTRTDNAQPAITAVSLAALRVLAASGIRPHAAAGHSLGEYSALVCAGVIGEEDALRLTRRRGELMQWCADRYPGGMVALLGASRDQAAEIVSAASPEGLAGVANINSEGQVVISGATGAVERAVEIARERGIRKVIPLKVSGAWHSPLMAEAAAALRDELSSRRFSDPSIPVVANVTAAYIASGDESRTLLERQVTSPVLWAASMRRLVEDGCDTFVEVGPGAVLQGLMKGFEGIRTFGTAGEEALGKTVEALA